ncbi:MAG: MBL fold metallo-hydrolase [Candidatus Pacebacteria bacterium]|nr:MBL fold metallo-hydrolase [Candidatus Paceibacterota bacterium]
MNFSKKYLPYFLIIILFLSTIFVWHFVVYGKNQTDYLTVAFLDVGQGDAIFIEAPNGKQMLVDGGPDGKVLQQLGEIMPFGDRSIDVVVATHPDLDHIGGLSFVLDNYNISYLVDNGIIGETEAYRELQNEISKNKINKVVAKEGMRIFLDQSENIYFDILYPDRDVSTFESNDSSIVGRLVYKDKSFMLTGDASVYTENIIKWNESKEDLNSQILKLGHHGAKTSSSILWLEDVSPEIAIVSAGRNNRYNHPSQEVLERLDSLNIPYLETSKEGNIIFKTDGLVLMKE